MRALSFLFAALLGLALAMMAPALAGPRPEAPQAPVIAAVAVDSPVDAAMSVDPISLSLLEAVSADAA